MNWGKMKSLFIYLFIVLNAVLLGSYIYTIQKYKTEIVQEKEIIEKAMKNDNITVEESASKKENLGYVNVTIASFKDFKKENLGLKYDVETSDKASVLKVSADTAITNVSKGNYRAELDAFLLEKFKFGSEYTFSSYSAKRNEIIYEQQIDGIRVFANKNARIVFDVDSNGDVKKFSLTSVTNIKKDKSETLVAQMQAVNRLYHEDLIPKNCNVKATLGYYTYISQTENQVLIPTWSVILTTTDGKITTYYVDAINLNILNRQGTNTKG